jgi:hypothetical protein
MSAKRMAAPGPSQSNKMEFGIAGLGRKAASCSLGLIRFRSGAINQSTPTAPRRYEGLTAVKAPRRCRAKKTEWREVEARANPVLEQGYIYSSTARP